MKIVEKLSERIDEEICDSKYYAKMALEYKESYPTLADAFYNLSLSEMEHMNILHNEVVKIIEQYKKEHGEPPSDMLAIYNYLHGKEIEKAKDVKVYQTMYKEK